MAQITMENVVYVQHTPAPAQILIPYFSSISTKRNASDTMSANPTAPVSYTHLTLPTIA